MRIINLITLLLVVVGGINWGFVGIAHFDMVSTLLGSDTIATRIVYILIGLAAVWQIVPMVQAADMDEPLAEAHLQQRHG